MANIKSNIKSIRKTQKRTIANKAVKTSLKNTIKKVRTTGNSELVPTVYQKADSALAKGKIHKNKANRIKSRMAKEVNRKQKANT
ncbi:MAG: 30S ribosomal protein S20 [Mycoplasmataceae bacterium]|jgi:small subunit ribosomal protein S20|nr:30S ribosomal protein S20 [Mycoplasmataceae bacterium]